MLSHTFTALFLGHWLVFFPMMPSRKRQLQFLLDGRGRRAGQSPEELRDNGKLLGEGLSRSLFTYPNRDAGVENTEVSITRWRPGGSMMAGRL